MRPWLPPWDGVEDAREATALEAELRRELAPGHVLHGLPARLIARRVGSDDALFALADGRVAEVHLTWIGQADTPPWPDTGLHDSLETWQRDVMRPEHAQLRRSGDGDGA